MNIKDKLTERQEVLNLESVCREIDVLMDNARFVAPYTEYAGMARNDIAKQIGQYIQKQQEFYQFEKKFELLYRDEENRPNRTW